MSKAHVAMLGKTSLSEWQQLATEARLIPNRADRAYTLAVIAQCSRGADILLAGGLLREAKSETDQIESLIDRAERLEIIANCGAEIDANFAKGCIREGLELTKRQDAEELDSVRKSLIDLAYEISPELASTLTSTFDDDPVRERRRAVKRQMEIRQLRQKLLDTPADAVSDALSDEDKIPEAAWMSLGVLNAGKAVPVHISVLRPYLEFAAHLPLRNAYPILSWCIENASRRRQSGARTQAEKTLRGIFEAALTACDVGARLSARVSAGFRQATSMVKSDTADGYSLLVKPHEKQAAITFIGTWIDRFASEYIKVCDAFIGPEEAVDLMKLVAQYAPNVTVYILTSEKYQSDRKVMRPLSDAYTQAWRQQSAQSPPETQIVIGSIQGTQDSPIHDRWIITKGAGLRLGTSLNGFGLEREAEISTMDTTALLTNETDLDVCLSMRRRYKGKAVSYQSFSM